MKNALEAREAVRAGHRDRQATGVEPYSMTIEGVGQHFGLSRSAVYRLIGDRKLVARKIGGRTMLITREVREMIETAPAAAICPRVAVCINPAIRAKTPQITTETPQITAETPQSSAKAAAPAAPIRTMGAA